MLNTGVFTGTRRFLSAPFFPSRLASGGGPAWGGRGTASTPCIVCLSRSPAPAGGAAGRDGGGTAGTGAGARGGATGGTGGTLATGTRTGAPVSRGAADGASAAGPRLGPAAEIGTRSV